MSDIVHNAVIDYSGWADWLMELVVTLSFPNGFISVVVFSVSVFRAACLRKNCRVTPSWLCAVS